MQLETDGGRVELLRNKGDLYRRDSSQNDWPSYGGQSGGNRYSAEATPGGCWRHPQRQHTKSLDEGQVNRGVAVSGDSRFHRHRQRSPAGIESLFSISDRTRIADCADVGGSRNGL